MNTYELMTLTKGSQGELKAKELSKEVTELIEKLGGKVEETDYWGKRKLAYQINRETDGFYEIFNLELSKDKVSELKKSLKLKDNLVRYLITANS